MLKKLILLTAFVYGPLSLVNAQSISRRVISTAGGTLTGGGNMITYSMGETVIPSLSAGGNQITSGFEQPGEQIITGTVSQLSYCSGTTISVPFNAIDIGGSNIFTAQLSNAAGSFAAPVSMGTLSGNASGTINATIPTSTPAGTGYRIRVVSSSPGKTGSDNGVNITINTAAPAANLPFPVVPAYACNGTNFTASTTPVAGVTTYTWDGPAGTTFNSTGNPYSSANSGVTVNYGAPNGSGYSICVQGSNACGTTTRRCTFVRSTVNVPGVITAANGRTTECAGTSANYSIAAVGSASGYTWSITGNATVIGTGTSATVNFGASWSGGSLCVTANTPCYSSAPRCLALSNFTALPGAISGAITACPGSNGNYSVPVVSGAATYNWIVPPNTTGSSNTNSINVSFLTGYTSGNIKISVTSICGITSAQQLKTISSGLPATPAGISGNAAGLCNQTIVYSCPVVTGATSYTWTTPAGATINSGQGSTSINASFGTFTNGNVCVKAINGCGTGAQRCIPVTGKPAISGNIIYTPGVVCANQSGVDFQISPVFGTTGYNWSFPAGVTSVLDLGNEQIVNWGSISGNVTVTAANACGNTTKSTSIALSCRETQEATMEPYSSVIVYPNPAHNKVNVEISVTEKTGYVLNILDLSGRVISTTAAIAQKGINTSEMDLTTIAKGVYVIALKSDLLNKQIRVVVQ